MNAIMDVNGATAYVVDDTKPAADNVLWSSLKTSRFYWSNVMKVPNFQQITPYNTTTTFTMPVTATVAMCVRGSFTDSGYFYYQINKTANDNFAYNKTASFRNFHTIFSLKQGDQLTFVSNQTNIDIQIQIIQI